MPTFPLKTPETVLILPTLALPVTVIAVTLALTAPILPTLALPVAFNVPAILAPVLVTTNTLPTPAEVILTLPLAVMVILLLPLASGPRKLVPLTLPLTISGLLRFQLSVAFWYNIVAAAGPSTVRPAPSATLDVVAPLAMVMLISATSTMVLFNVVVVPDTNKSPPTVKLPRILAVPEVYNVPAILAPVPVTTNTLPTPADVTETLPLGVIVMLLLPLASGPIKLSPVMLAVAVTVPVILAFPEGKVKSLLTFKLPLS